MLLKGILSISGYPGLFKLISQGKTSIIVESIEDKKRMPAYASSKISALEDIAIFTSDEEIPLKEVLKTIYTSENGQLVPSTKITDKEIKNYFEEVLPTYDKNRVYVSDMKKVVNWYNLLQKHDLLIFDESEETAEKVETGDQVENTPE